MTAREQAISLVQKYLRRTTIMKDDAVAEVAAGQIIDALLAAKQGQECPTCGGYEQEPPYEPERCPDCSDGVVPGTEPLIILGPELVAYHDDQRSPYWFNEAYIKENPSVFARAYPVYRRAGSPHDADEPVTVCSKCGAEWRYEVDGRTYSRRIGIYDQRADRTRAWRCPDCGDEVPR